jgi:hypothetical protein
LDAIKQELIIQPANNSIAASQATTAQISYVQQAASFTTLQKHMEDTKPKKRQPSFKRLLSKVSKGIGSGNANIPVKLEKQARFATPTPAITVTQHEHVENLSPTSTNSNDMSVHCITELCSSLRNCQEPCIGIILDESDCQFQLSKPLSPGPVATAPDTARLVPLPELLDAYRRAEIAITRQNRFEMAFHIASALLQTHLSPWLTTKWSKHDLYFLADSHNLYSNEPYVSQTFTSNIPDAPAPTTNSPIATSTSISEEDSRFSLFTVGVIVLELIFLATTSNPVIFDLATTAPIISPMNRRTLLWHEYGRRMFWGSAGRKSPTW